jgi:hypothetical protein
LAKRAGQKRGWSTVTCTLYGQTMTKTYKTFLATYHPVGGVIRVVLLKEEHGWRPVGSNFPLAISRLPMTMQPPSRRFASA